MEGLTISGLETMSGVDSSLLAGRYRVVRPLGQGGMGSVWLAEDTVLDGMEVAIKMLPSILAQNRRAYQQLKSEALVAIKLSHSSIASVRSFEENNGNPFIVEAYIEGITLDAYLAEKGGTLSEEETLALLKPIADALDYAHAKGVVHRDVKPANVIIDKTGHPFVLDFGIAREAQETMTMVTGKLSSGTLLYMSPEQLKGAAPTAAQDVYSFATMVYECLTGRPPFYRGQVEYQIVNELPEPLSPKFSNRESIMAGLAKDPAVRPATCAAVLAGGTAGPRIPQERSKSTGGGKIRGVLAVVVLGLFAAGGWFVYSQHLAKERSESETFEAYRDCLDLAVAKSKTVVEPKTAAEGKTVVSVDRRDSQTQELKAEMEELCRPPDEKSTSTILDAVPMPPVDGTCLKTPMETRPAFKPYEGASKAFAVKDGGSSGKFASENGIIVPAHMESNGLQKDTAHMRQNLKPPAENGMSGRALRESAVVEKEQKAACKALVEEVKKLEAEITKLQSGEEYVSNSQKYAQELKSRGEGRFRNGHWGEAFKDFKSASEILTNEIKRERRRRRLYTGPTATYVVKMGDSLDGIADGHGIAIHALKELNNLQSDVLKVGMQIRVPAKAVNR